MLPIPAGYPVEWLSGPQIIGDLLNWGLFGTLSMQLSFPKDRRSIKCLVYGIYIVEFVQTMIVTHDTYASFGYGFGELEALTEICSSWLVVPIMDAITASVGQGFYAYRIYILSRSRIVPAFVICVSLTSSVAVIITGVYMFQASDITKLNDQKTSISLGISAAGYALCDIVIAICMTYYLMRHNTSFPQTRILITKLIRLIIETGSLTGIYPYHPLPSQDLLRDASLGPIQAICQYHLHGAEFSNPNHRWSGYLYISYRYGDHDHYDEGYHFPFNAGRTANPSGCDN